MAERQVGGPTRTGAVRERYRACVEAVLASLPPGEVMSYGEVAEEAGYPGTARGVGGILAHPRPGSELPWWRVVNAAGRLAPGKEQRQAALLEKEGVVVRDGHVRRPGR